MIKHGVIPTIDHRDLDYLKSLHPQVYAGIVTPTFPDEFIVDTTGWFPDQETTDSLFSTPPLPYGCTNFVQALLSYVLSGVRKDPTLLENITHANARGGADIREALKGAIALKWLNWFFNVDKGGKLDYFDTIRLAIMEGIPEKRAVSWGTPWFDSWEIAALNQKAIMPTPTARELQAVQANPRALSWHNSAFIGWKLINGTPQLLNKSLQGTHVGDAGLLYFSREAVNAVMDIDRTVAFTGTLLFEGTVDRIDLPTIQKLLSFISKLLGFSY